MPGIPAETVKISSPAGLGGGFLTFPFKAFIAGMRRLTAIFLAFVLIGEITPFGSYQAAAEIITQPSYVKSGSGRLSPIHPLLVGLTFPKIRLDVEKNLQDLDHSVGSWTTPDKVVKLDVLDNVHPLVVGSRIIDKEAPKPSSHIKAYVLALIAHREEFGGNKSLSRMLSPEAIQSLSSLESKLKGHILDHVRDQGSAEDLAEKLGFFDGFGVAPRSLPAVDPAASTEFETRPHQSSLYAAFNSVGPRQGRLEFHSHGGAGPIWDVRYIPQDPVPLPARTAADSRDPVVVIVGGVGPYSQWISDAARETVQDKIAVQYPGARILNVGPEIFKPRTEGENYLVGDVLDISDGNQKNVSAALIRWLDEHHANAVAVAAFEHQYALWGPVLQEAVRAAEGHPAHNPNIPGTPVTVMRDALDKVRVRQILQENVPRLYLPFYLLGSLIDPEIISKAIAGFSDLVPEGTGLGVVLKLVASSGKALNSTKGIFDVESLRSELTRLQEEYQDWAGDSTLMALYSITQDGSPPLLFLEQHLPILAEYDVNSVSGRMQVGEEEILRIVASVAGNADRPSDLAKETGYMFPAMLSEDLQVKMILAHVEMLLALHDPHLPLGADHGEWALHGNPYAPQVALIEHNPRAPGDKIPLFIKDWAGLDIIGQSILALSGFALEAPERQPPNTLVVSKVLAGADGTLVSMSQNDSPHSTIDPDVPENRNISGATHATGTVLARVATSHKNPLTALASNLKTLSGISIRIQTDEGAPIAHSGDLFHHKSDYQSFPKSRILHFPSLLGFISSIRNYFGQAKTNEDSAISLSAKAAGILGLYEKAQHAWAPIWSIYRPFFTPVISAVAGGLSAAGSGALSKSIAYILAGPFASLVPNRVPMRSILLATKGMRILIWSLAIPLAVVYLPSGAAALSLPLLGNIDALYFAIVALNFIDGVLVAFQDPVDLNMGGLDVLAGQYGFSEEITPGVRKHFSARYAAWTSKAQFIFPTLIALAASVAAQYAFPVKWSFLLAMALSFLALGTRSLWFLSKLPAADNLNPAPWSWTGFLRDFRQGFAAFKDIRLSGRAAFGAAELAMWEGLRGMLIPTFGMLVIAPALTLNGAWGNLFGTLLVAGTSVATLSASNRFRSWRAPKPDEGEYPFFKQFFPLTFYSGLSTLAIPAAYFLIQGGSAAWIALGLAVVAAGVVIFGFFYQYAQLGWWNLFQKAAKEQEGGAHVYGISGAIVEFAIGGGLYTLGRYIDQTPLGDAFKVISMVYIGIGLMGWWLSRYLPSRHPPKPKSK